MNVKFKIPQGATDRLVESLKESVTDIVEDVAVKTYNTVISGIGVDYPYWSGSYVTNWRIKVGSEDTTPPKIANEPRTFSAPDQIEGLYNIAFGQPVYITNRSPHAYQVEFLGTPTQPDEGWYTAAHAVNQVVLTYKFSMG